MQGQGSTNNSLPDSIDFDYGSPPTNVGLDQQIFWNDHRSPAESTLSDYRISASNLDNTHMGGVVHEGRNMGRWNVGGPSSSNSQNHVCHEERVTQNGWSPPINTSIGAGLRLEEQLNVPVNPVSHSGVTLNLNTNQIITRTAFVRGSSSISASPNFDLNEGRFHRVGNDIDCANSSKSIGFESGGFLVEDDDVRNADCSLDGRRLSCKRKTIEGNVGQSSGGGSFSLREQGSAWQAIHPSFDAGTSMSTAATPEISSNPTLPVQVNQRLGLGIGVRVPPSVPRGLEGSRRNNRLRMSPSVQQDSMSNNSFLPVPASVTRHPENPSTHRSLRLAPINPSPDLMSPIPPEIPAPQNRSTILRAPTMRRNVQSHGWNNLRRWGLSSSALSGEGDDMFDDSSSRILPRTIGEAPMFAPRVEARSSSSHSTNLSLSGGSLSISRNIGSSSGSGSNAGSHSLGEPSEGSNHHPSLQHHRRLSEYVRRSLLSTVGPDIAGQISSSSHHNSVPGSPQDGVIPSGGRNQAHNHTHSRSASWMERQGDSAGGIPYLRALVAAGEGRSRLVSEIRNALDILRRGGGEGLQIEDVMLLDQSVFFGMADVHDQHRDMRLDVDNMSYEELLALEERIGNVCTGLSKEIIIKCMKQRKHVHTISNDQTETEPCCVCQEVYKDGEDIGTLDCGHDFHRDCITQWLSQKNLCPICKTAGLAT